MLLQGNLHCLSPTMHLHIPYSFLQEREREFSIAEYDTKPRNQEIINSGTKNMMKEKFQLGLGISFYNVRESPPSGFTALKCFVC
jgi:hypothetical protein